MVARAPLLLLVAALSGCSFIDDFERFHGRHDAGMDGGGPAPDAGDEEGGSDADTEPDADVAADASEAGADADLAEGDELCAGEADGTPCGPDQGRICLKGFCRASRCGDGFVDGARDEQCDDANLMRGDGCEPASCTFSCTAHADCDNGFVCDGDELCDVRHRCVKDDVPSTNTPCTRDGVAGVCNDSGYCVRPGCGDGLVMTGEECDPAQVPPTPGCRADCTQGCIDDAQCRDQDDCNGEESCETSSGECQPGTALACQDGDPCTQDGQCEAASGCVYTLLDGDGDRVSAQTCAPGSAHQGGDCNDADASIYPGATEYCDGIDNDCDAQRDEGAVMAVCYPDRDRDGYPDRQGGQSACSCPAGTRPPRADGQWDCWDDPQEGGNDVHPGQTAYFEDPYNGACSGSSGDCKSFDYDCDGEQTPLYRAGSGTCSVLGAGLACSGDGYTGAAPACGANGNYLICTGGALLSCTSKSEQRRQVCH